jgi:multiple sugar transport system permease protein
MAVHELHWEGGNLQARFSGARNLELFVADKLYWVGLRNTSVFAALTVGLQMLFGLVLALAAHRMRRARAALLAVFLLPIVVPPIVIGAMWKLMLNADIGIVNALLARAGIGRIDWLGDSRFALATVVAVDVWHWTPFTFLLLLAGLESLPTEVHEAAQLDTRSAWQEFRHVTLPLLWPTIAVTALFRLILSFKVFDEIYLLTAGGPGTSTEVVSYSIYRTFFAEDRAGLGSMMALFTLATVAAAAFALARLRSKHSK